jgi:hypothetical protein
MTEFDTYQGMASLTEESFCVVEYAEKVMQHVQKAFRKRLHEDPPPRASTQVVWLL